MNSPINTNPATKGRRRRNQDMFVYPALQRACRTKVQKATYAPLASRTAAVLDTSQPKFPAQNSIEFPAFWNISMMRKNTDMAR